MTDLNESKNKGENEPNSASSHNQSDQPFFIDSGVDTRCYDPIKRRFEVLFDSKKIIQQRLADDLGLDKAYISRICNGIEIPPHHIRIKISSYFAVDSSTIWRITDLPFINKILKQQEKIKNANKN